MVLFKKATDLHKYIDGQWKKEKKMAFVPTMGALHEGHLSLVRQAQKDNSFIVCSIFINPIQFNDPSDFRKYPVTIENDIFLLETNGCDILFLPSIQEIYPNGINIKPHYDLGYLESVLEGKYRPGHFQGVCAVVNRLLEIVKPERLYLGQKDYQQCLIIKRLIEQTGLSKSIEITIAPTQREDDGLAMSSRNMRLDKDNRKKASVVYQALSFIKENLQPGNLNSIKQTAESFLKKQGFKVDYIEIADADDLSIINDWNGKQKLVALAAAYLGDVRLIDNILLK